MSIRYFAVAGASALVLCGAALAVSAQTEQEGRLSGGRPVIAPPAGKAVFDQNCASCHTAEGLNMGGRIVPTVSSLRAMPPEGIHESLVDGKMKIQGAGLTDAQKKQVSEYLAGRALVDVVNTGVDKMTGRCKANPPIAAALSKPAWNGWGAGLSNARFQSGSAAGLTPVQVGKLKLKWAFGLPQGASSYSQPTVFAGRVFVGSDNAAVYAIDAESGCALWSFHGDAAGRFAPVVAPVPGKGSGWAVLFVTKRGTAYAVDAQDGKELWKTAMPNANISGSSAYHDGRLYVGLTGTETVAGSNPNYECCKSRGGLVSIDTLTGKVVWRVDSIAEPLEKIGKSPTGVQLWGPSGASVWNTPTIDPKRGLVYVGTGNSFGPKAASTSDSILAFDIKTGKLVWSHQEFKDDSFMLGCPDANPAGGACPARIGPDWDFGGASAILAKLPNGKEVILAAGKGGVAIALDPDAMGKLIWRTPLYDKTPPTADGLVLFGGAVEGSRVYYPLQQAGGGLAALDIATGKRLWTAKLDTDGRGQIGAASAIPGVVFTGGWDGIVRAVGADGKVLWRYDTRRSFKTTNGVEAKGGSLGSPGPTIAGGRVYLSSGYIGMQAGSPGNAILAFAPG